MGGYISDIFRRGIKGQKLSKLTPIDFWGDTYEQAIQGLFTAGTSVRSRIRTRRGI